MSKREYRILGILFTLLFVMWVSISLSFAWRRCQHIQRDVSNRNRAALEQRQLERDIDYMVTQWALTQQASGFESDLVTPQAANG